MAKEELLELTVRSREFCPMADFRVKLNNEHRVARFCSGRFAVSR